MKFSMTGQENVTFKYRWLLNSGYCMGRLDCTHFNENISMISAECIILSYTFMNTSNNIDMVAMEIKQNIFNIITTQEWNFLAILFVYSLFISDYNLHNLTGNRISSSNTFPRITYN